MRLDVACPRCVVILVLLIASATARSEPEFEVRIRSVEFAARRDFPLPKGYTNWSDSERTEIRPRFEIGPLRGAPIIGAEPRLRLGTMRAQDGTDLLASGARVLVGDAYSAERPRFLFPGSSGGLPTSACYGESMQPSLLTIPLASLPGALGAVEGELTVQVVSEDTSAEFAVTDGPQEHLLAPGVHMRLDPRGGPNGQASASYSIDPGEIDGPAPILNFATYSCGQMRDVIPFKPARGFGGGARGTATFALQGLDYGKAMIFTHLVYASRTVTVPFRIESTPITGFTPPPDAPGERVEAPGPSVAAKVDGYEVRLVRLLVRGSQKIGGATGTTRSANVLLRVGVLDTTDQRAFGRYMSCRIDSITDTFGRPVGEPTAARCDDDRGTGGAVRFLPRDALPVDKFSYRDAGARMVLVTIPFEAVPPQLGLVRGRMEFAEATGSFTAEADLKPSAEPVELGPGVRLVVREPTPMPNVLPKQPSSSWVTIQVDLPPGTPSTLDESSAPRVNLVQFFGPDGKVRHPESSFVFRRVGDRLDYPIGQVAYLDGATRVRVQVITSAARRSLPFEFGNIPCGSR